MQLLHQAIAHPLQLLSHPALLLLPPFLPRYQPSQQSAAATFGQMSSSTFRRSGQLLNSKSAATDGPSTSASEAGPSSTQQGSSTMGMSVPFFIPTYEISSDDSSPAQSLVQQQKTSVCTSMLHEVFPCLKSGQASLLLDLYNNNVMLQRLYWMELHRMHQCYFANFEL